MDKEIISPEFLRKYIYRGNILAVVVLPILCLLLILIMAPLVVVFSLTQHYFRAVLCGSTVVFSVFMMGYGSYTQIKRLRCMPKEPIVVVAKRIPTPSKQPDEFYGNRQIGYYLYFENYGRYAVIGNAYPKGACDDLSARGLWESSMIGDEFYLVLDHEYKILLAYHCNYFEYTGEITRHTVVNGRIQKQ